MAFYKLCDCGNKTFFEHRGQAPRRCGNCGRSLLEFSVKDEAEDESPEADVLDEVEEKPSEERRADGFYYSLDTMDGGQSIIIPSTGGIVGRAALGADILEDNHAVSREHIRVRYSGRIGVLVEDKSKYGTFVNGERLIKGTPKFVRDGDIVRLYSVELRVTKHEEE